MLLLSVRECGEDGIGKLYCSRGINLVLFTRVS